MMKKIKAFTLIEMLVVVAIIALLIAILLPSLARARELARQTICGTNMKEIGTTFYIYQSDNLDDFPTVAHHKESGQTAPVVFYIENLGGGAGGAPGDPERDQISSEPNDPRYGDGTPGSTKISTTRSLWLLVRTGEVIPKQFVCPTAIPSSRIAFISSLPSMASKSRTMLCLRTSNWVSLPSPENTPASSTAT